jgi:hypothetical protein
MITEQPAFSVTSTFMSACSIFTGSNKIKVYVEAYDDIAFWTKEFTKEFETEEIDVCTVSNIEGSSGKCEILKFVKNSSLKLGKNLLVAVDSDYDYILDKEKDFYRSEFVFQTYVYAIENIFWNPNNIDVACTCAAKVSIKTNLLERVTFWSLNVYNDFICQLNTGSPDKGKIKEITLKIKELNPYPKDLPECNDDYLKKGLTLNNVFLYIRGHDLESYLNELCVPIIKEHREREFRRLKGMSRNQAGDCKNFAQTLDDLKTVLSSSYIYCDQSVGRISGDIKKLKSLIETS